MFLAFEVDTAAQAGYIELSKQPVARTEQFSASVMVDFDADGRPVGIEMLNLNAYGEVAEALSAHAPEHWALSHGFVQPRISCGWDGTSYSRATSRAAVLVAN